MVRRISFFICLILSSSCGILNVSSGTDFKRSEINKVDFCDLESYNGKLVKTKLKYSGVEEYWSAYGSKDCELNHKVYLNFDEYYDGWKWILIDGQLSRLHRKYPTHKAVMTVIGVFEKDSLQGFGHLNTMPAEIMVKRVRINLKRK